MKLPARNLSKRNLILLLTIACLAAISIVLYPTIKTNTDISSAERLSAQAQAAHPSHACKAFSLLDARNMFGDDMVMNNAFRKSNTNTYSYDGIRFDSKDITVSNCTYASSGRSVQSTIQITVGIRDTHNLTTQKAQYAAFTQKFSDEKPISIEQWQGFYDDTHNGATLRLWAKDRWFEVNAPNLEDAKRVITILIKNA
jgi:hypothetical protein